jgi:hypothetical protein
MSIRIGIVGDIMGHLGSAIQEREGCPLEATLDAGVQSLCRSHDELWGNLEGPCAHYSSHLDGYLDQLPEAVHAPHLLHTRPTLQFLSGLGFRVLSIANNHAFDLHTAEDPAVTARLVAEAGIEPVGRTLTPLVRVIDGMSFAIFGVTTVINGTLRDRRTDGIAMIEGDLARPFWPVLRSWRRQVDTIVVLVHWGQPFTGRPDGEVLALCKNLIEAGVDVVVGSHPHVLWPMWHDGPRGVVAFSLGNFLQVFGVPRAWRGYEVYQRALHSGLLTLEVSRDRITPLFTPVRLHHNFEQWFAATGCKRSFWTWDRTDVDRWLAGMSSRTTRLRSSLEVDGPTTIGELTSEDIQRRYATSETS